METGQKRPLITELTQGKEFTNQLKNHLDNPTSAETCEVLVEKILSSYEKALSMLNWRCAIDDTPTPFDNTSPRTQLSDPADSNSPNNSNNKNVFKKRKPIAKWSEQVKVCSGALVEGPLSDGYSWRKYGQKEILGANHPRAYYRCTHRHVQGCLATKQVQRSDEDSSVYEVTYKGRHTCIHATELSKALEKKPKKEEKTEKDSRSTKKRCMDRVFSFKISKGLNASDQEGLFPSFSFASTPIETEKLENLFYGGCDSTTFITLNHNLQSSDSDLSEMMNSTPNSATNSPLVDWDLTIDYEDFDSNFVFDITKSEMFA
ncbi:probable WRKY transcription factor 53 [Rutidosis leptorrhynchoides]|uniref:probable WRKY transcription factor 53 n=1 Tax=Rutidosis leptorrhynchoides TaxID=125765 RepID=UPI003A99BF54